MTEKEIISFLRECNLSRSGDYWNMELGIRKTAKDMGIPIKTCDGATKICIIFKDEDFVVKFSFEDHKVDEAVKEAEIYQDAIENHLEMFFPYTKILTTIDDVTFVLQRKIDFSAAERSEKLAESYNKITQTVPDRIVDKVQAEFSKAHSSFRRRINVEWVKMCVSIYGKRRVKQLCAFVIKHKINDLHSYNVGYYKNKPLILDFSGYDNYS